MTKQGNQIYRNSSGNSKKNGIYAVNVAPTYFLLKKKINMEKDITWVIRKLEETNM